RLVFTFSISMTRSALQAGFRVQFVVELDWLFHPLTARVFLREAKPQKEQAKQSDQYQWKKPAHCSSSRQTERDHRVAEGFVVFVPPPPTHHSNFFPVLFPLKGHGVAVPPRGNFRDQDLFASLFTNPPEGGLLRRRDKTQAPRRPDRTAEIRRPGWRNA